MGMEVLKHLADEIFEQKQEELRQIIREELSRFFSNSLQYQHRPYLKTGEVCELLSCSPNTLKEICVQYNIKPKRLIGTNYYRRSDIDNAMTDEDLISSKNNNQKSRSLERFDSLKN
jgi:hypothetical protein